VAERTQENTPQVFRDHAQVDLSIASWICCSFNWKPMRTKTGFDQQNTQPEQPMLTWVKTIVLTRIFIWWDPQIKDFRLATLRPIYSGSIATPYMQVMRCYLVLRASCLR